ncbi:hypothetical protein V8E55_002107 [Tylopilus felleus]
MDSDLKCNRLNCRKTLVDKAVVTTCSHIFCLECANELFNASRLCPACETSLIEPDDVVVCCLHPTNDYKTSVLSGLSPSIIMEICSRALSFWQYQIHQENSFQHAVTRNLNDKNAQLQKQLENVIREANGEINLLGSKVAELERDLELERRKVHELQDTSREREKEYQKLKAQLDRVKRRALLGPDAGASGANQPPVQGFSHSHRSLDNQPRQAVGEVDVGAVVGGMEAIGIQRTPLVNRVAKGNIGIQGRSGLQVHSSAPSRAASTHRHPLNTGDRSFLANSVSDRSDSAHEVEHLLLPKTFKTAHSGMQPGSSGWGTSSARPHAVQQRPFNLSTKRGFKPAR